MLQRGRETWRKERKETVKERERERSMGRGETRVSDSESVRREKTKEKIEKVRKLTMRKRRHQNIIFPMAIDKDNIYRRCNT